MMCIVHKNRETVGGKKTCLECRRRIVLLREFYSISGICACGRMPENGRKTCNFCLTKSREQRAKYKSKGLCSCGKPVLGKGKKCDYCLEKANSRVETFRLAGLCYCGKNPPKERYDQCQECLDRKNLRISILKANGKCQCGQPTTGNYKLCLRCRNIASSRMMELLRTDANFAAITKLRGCVYTAIKRDIKADNWDRTEYFLGCTVSFARQHIQSLFQPGMSWGNTKLWHIDHHIPCSDFNLRDKRQQLLCSNWRNLKPLWASDNLSKKDKLPAYYKIRLAELEEAVK